MICRIYNPKAEELNFVDKVYEEIYQYCIDNNIRFRVEYVGLLDDKWIKHRITYHKKIKSIILFDKSDLLVVKLRYGDYVETHFL